MTGDTKIYSDEGEGWGEGVRGTSAVGFHTA